MLYQDLIFCLREVACGSVFKQSSTPKHPQECFLNPPCNCANPGKELECEDCPHLEACFSQFKSVKSARRPLKLSVTGNTITYNIISSK